LDNKIRFGHERKKRWYGIRAESGAAGKKEMGKVMELLMPKVKGCADGKLVKQIVLSLLP